MAKNSWQIYLDKAVKAKIESERCLGEAVHALMACKGFTQLSLFDACFAGGVETVISFNRECEMADLDIEVAAGMTKDEIIDRLLSTKPSKETIELLKEERI